MSGITVLGTAGTPPPPQPVIEFKDVRPLRLDRNAPPSAADRASALFLYTFYGGLAGGIAGGVTQLAFKNRALSVAVGGAALVAGAWGMHNAAPPRSFDPAPNPDWTLSRAQTYLGQQLVATRSVTSPSAGGETQPHPITQLLELADEPAPLINRLDDADITAAVGRDPHVAVHVIELARPEPAFAAFRTGSEPHFALVEVDPTERSEAGDSWTIESIAEATA